MKRIGEIEDVQKRMYRRGWYIRRLEDGEERGPARKHI